MKKSIFLLFASFSTVAFAQNGLFLQPEVGYGIANVTPKTQISGNGFIYQVDPAKNISSFSGGLLLGYRFNHLEWSTGATFLRSGYSESYTSGDFVLMHNTSVENFYHFAIPLNVGYCVNLTKHLFIQPGIGVSASYNYAVHEQTTESTGSSSYTTSRNLTNTEFNNLYNRFSIWGTAHVHVCYKFNSRINIIAGPETQFMTGSVKQSGNFTSDQKNYVYTFNAGLTWKLYKK